MNRSRILQALLFVALTACNANEADTADAAGDAAPAAASDGNGDLVDLRDYDLTMDDLDKLFEAQLNLARAASRMSPAEREAMEAGSGDNATLDDMAAAIDRNPVMKKAVNDADLSAREFAVASMALLQAAMAKSIIDMRPDDNQDSLALAMDTNPDNVKFMQQHMDEITRKQQEVEAEVNRLVPPDQE